jgi:parallel beta-helix repeat protein
MNVTSNSAASSGWCIVYNNGSISLPSSFKVDVDVYFSAMMDVLPYFNAVSGPFYVMRFDGRTSQSDLIGYYPAGAGITTVLRSAGITSPTNTWLHHQTIRRSSGLWELRKGGDLATLGTLEASYTHTTITSGGFGLTSDGAPGTTYFDNLRIRKFTDPEPSTSVGAEEMQDATPPTIIIISPETTTYTYPSILINISATDDVGISAIWYNWNGTNVTYTEPVYVTFPTGTITLYAYANDTSGNVNSTSVTFNVVGCFCDSCSSCTDALNNASCAYVYLTSDIIDYAGTCINNPVNFNNKIFDCQGHVIDGNLTSNSYGIYLSSHANNTIRNCTVTEFYYGIYMPDSFNFTLRNNVMNNNTYNFVVDGEQITHFYHDIDTSNLVDGKPIYYWTDLANAPNGCSNAEINETSNAGFVALVSCQNITVKNLNLSKNGHGILVVNTTNSEILHNIIADERWYGILLFSSLENTLFNNTASNSNYGIHIYLSSNNNITNNEANSNFYDGIVLVVSSNNSINNNVAYNNSRYGIYLYYSSSYNTLTNNIANYNNWDGIYLFSSPNNTLTNNTANNNNGGIYLVSSPYNTLTNNTANYNNWNGIYLYSSSYNTLTNNTVNNNNGGIYLISSSDNNNITSNTANYNNWDGIYLYSSLNNNITNNTVNNNEYGIYLYSSPNNTLTNNIANYNSYCGIYLSSSSNYNTLTNNTASNNTQHGIYLESSSNNTLTNNTANYNSYHGIYLSSSSNYNTLTSNTANNNNNIGIRLSSSSNNTIDNNTASNNIYGIYLSSSSNNNVSGNIIGNSSLYDIYVKSDSNYNSIYLNMLLSKGIKDEALTTSFYSSYSPFYFNAENFTEILYGAPGIGCAVVTADNQTISFLDGSTNLDLILVNDSLNPACGIPPSGLRAVYCVGCVGFGITNCSVLEQLLGLNPGDCRYFKPSAFVAQGLNDYLWNDTFNSTYYVLPGYVSPPYLKINTSAYSGTNIYNVSGEGNFYVETATPLPMDSGPASITSLN